MHAVFVSVRISDFEQARQMLESRVVPGVKQAPGFQSGVWLAPEGNSGQGNSIVVFDSEDNARTAAERVRAQVPTGVEVLDVQVREVAAQA